MERLATDAYRSMVTFALVASAGQGPTQAASKMQGERMSHIEQQYLPEAASSTSTPLTALQPLYDGRPPASCASMSAASMQLAAKQQLDKLAQLYACSAQDESPLSATSCVVALTPPQAQEIASVGSKRSYVTLVQQNSAQQLAQSGGQLLQQAQQVLRRRQVQKAQQSQQQQQQKLCAQLQQQVQQYLPCKMPSQHQAALGVVHIQQPQHMQQYQQQPVVRSCQRNRACEQQWQNFVSNSRTATPFSAYSSVTNSRVGVGSVLQQQQQQRQLVSQGSGVSSYSGECFVFAETTSTQQRAVNAPVQVGHVQQAPAADVSTLWHQLVQHQQQQMLSGAGVGNCLQQQAPLNSASSVASSGSYNAQVPSHQHRQLLLQQLPQQPPAKRAATQAAMAALLSTSTAAQVKLQQQQLQQQWQQQRFKLQLQYQQTQQQQVVAAQRSSASAAALAAQAATSAAAAASPYQYIGDAPRARLLLWAGQVLSCNVADAAHLCLHIYSRVAGRLDDMLLISLGVGQSVESVVMLVSMWVALKLEGSRRQVAGCSKLAAVLQVLPWAVTAVELHLMQLMSWQPYAGWTMRQPQSSCTVAEL